MTDFQLNDGHTLPRIGFGTWKMAREDTGPSVRAALAAGYRLIDTAQLYGNEAEVGSAVGSGTVPRSEITVTTKIWNDQQGYGRALRSFADSEKAIGVGVDLLLIHWPCPADDLYVETWRAFIELREAGRVRSIGVSNFLVPHLERLIGETGVVPAVNQVEMHPFHQVRDLREFHRAHGIITQAWSPLHQGTRLLGDPRVISIARAVGVSPAQAVLAWHLARGVVPLPKTVHPLRAAENLAACQVTLPARALEALDALNEDKRRGLHPDAVTAGPYRPSAP